MKNIKDIIKETNKNISKEVTYKSLSVSKTIELLKKGFDREGMSKRCSEKGFDDPESKYYQMSPEAILEKWDKKASESRHYGSLLDDYVGMILNEKADELEVWKLDNSYDYNERLNNLCNGFDEFYKVLYENTGYRYVTREEKMYIKSNKTGEYINGRFDCLFYSEKDDRYMLIDWKTSESIDSSNHFEKLQGPLYDYDACNLNEYSIQLLMYKKALCEVYNITTPDKIDTFICQFAPNVGLNGNSYKIHKTNLEYSSSQLDNVIEFVYKKNNMKK